MSSALIEGTAGERAMSPAVSLRVIVRNMTFQVVAVR
jgi:hypothetical protein